MITKAFILAKDFNRIGVKIIRDHVTARLRGDLGDNGDVQGYRDDGVVLRTHKLGEADRIITLLTRQNGRVRAVAKGVRRTKSRFGGRLEPFTHVDVLIHPGRSLDVIQQAEVIRAYGKPLATDYPRYTAGTAMLETAERFTPVEKEPAIRQFLLLIGGLRALGETDAPHYLDEAEEADEFDEADGLDDVDGLGGADGLGRVGEIGGAGVVSGDGGLDAPAVNADHDGSGHDGSGRGGGRAAATREPRLVLDAYLLRSLALEGYAPALEECARCGVTAASGTRPLVAFTVAAGGMVCANCRQPGSASPAPQTVALMRALLRGDWDAAMRSERRHRVECSGLVAAYLQWHLEHSIRSLRHVERA
jgi:recombinational DNA repair protein (RecF pathway)